MMNQYAVYGGRLHSELVLPELPRSRDDGAPDWVLRVGDNAPPVGEEAEELGRADVDEGVMVRLFAVPGGYRLAYDDTGTFDIRSNGRELTWYPAASADPALAQLDLMGRVLSLALYAEGLYCLHASSVSIDGQAIAFMAPKFHGKSTTAFSLVSAGAALITDDTLPIQVAQVPMVRPGVQRVRLWSDSVDAVGADASEGLESAGKFVVGELSAGQVLEGTAPLSTLYLMAPVESHPSGVALTRTRLNSVESALALVAHSKLGGLLGGSQRVRLFRQATELASRVPVYRLSIARDFDRLPEVVDQLQIWQRQASGPRPAVGAEAV